MAMIFFLETNVSLVCPDGGLTVPFNILLFTSASPDHPRSFPSQLVRMYIVTFPVVGREIAEHDTIHMSRLVPASCLGATQGPMRVDEVIKGGDAYWPP